MKLIAVNERFAVYEDDGAAESGFDPIFALDALLSVRTYDDMLGFLASHACRKSFAFSSAAPYREWDEEMRVWPNDLPSPELRGSLTSALEKYPEVDYLDKLTVADLDETETFDICIHELIAFRDTIAKLMVVSAVAIGYPSPSWLYEEVDTADVFDEEWWRDLIGTEMKNSRTFLLDLGNAGVSRHGLFDPWFFEGSVFWEDAQHGRYPDGCNFEQFIFSAPEYLECNERDLTDFVSVTVLQNDSEATAASLRACAGKVVEVIINHSDSLQECAEFSLPPFDDGFFERYKFVPEKGFVKNEVDFPDIWFELLLDEAIKSIVDGKVKLCPQCGTPVLVRDLRGRFKREFCSDRCKTASSKNRRENVIRLAASGASVDDAVLAVGERYRKSVEKWYAEALSADPAR